MFPILGRLAHRLLADASQHATPRCIAAGAAIGAVLGLIPWDSLIAVGLVVAVFALPIHQLAAVLGLLLTSSLHGFLAPVPDAVGGWVLSSSWTLEGLRRIWSMPLVPWLRLNNTMVVGSLCLGAITAIPHWALLRWCMQPAAFADTDRREVAADMDQIAIVAAQFRKGNLPETIEPDAALDTSPESPSLSLAELDSRARPQRDGSSTASLNSSSQSSSSWNTVQPMIAEPSSSSMDSSPLSNASATRTHGNHEPSSSDPAIRGANGERTAPCQRTLAGPGSSDALRYLLRHLTANRSPRDGATTP